MKESVINLGKWISDCLREDCNTEDYLLNQDSHQSSLSNLLELDGTATEHVIVSFLNSGLGPSNDYIQ